MPFDCPDWPPRWPEFETEIGRILHSGDWGRYRSPICDQLRAGLTNQFGVSDARLCCSGSAAIEIALRAARIGPGDEVITAAYDYPASFRTIELLGAKPVLVDVRSESVTIDASQLETAASDQVRAVVASHLYGQAAEIGRLRQLCDEREWVLIEDACQAPGMMIDGKPVGSFGHFAALSFGGSKLISAGNGGALLIGEDPSGKTARLAARLGALLDRPGDTFPLAPLQAAVIQPQLDRLQQCHRMRNGTVDFLRRVVVPQTPRWQWHVESDNSVSPAHYKVAWTAESDEHRRRIIHSSEGEGVPIGAGFRSMSSCSERRCRKPIPTPNADRFGNTLLVLDHRALLLEPPRHAELATALFSIYQQTL